MLTSVIPRLPAGNIEMTKQFYLQKLGFDFIAEYPDYLLVKKDEVELHFYLDINVNPRTTDKMIYIRVTDIVQLHEELKNRGIVKPGFGQFERKPWGQTEFSITDINGTLLTFGQPS